MIDALVFRRITFSFFEATAVHCASSDAATMVAYVGCCVGSGTGNHFLEHWRTKLQMLVKYAARHVKHIISKYAWVYLINPAIIRCPGHVIKPSRATPRCASQ